MSFCLLSSAVFVFFFFLKSSIQKTVRNFIRVSNSLDPDQEQINFGPDLGQNCFQTETAHLVLCMLGTLYTSFYCLIFCRLFPLLKIKPSKKLFRNSITVSNSLDPDQARLNVGPDLGQNCLQRSSAYDTSIRQRVFIICCFFFLYFFLKSSFPKNFKEFHLMSGLIWLSTACEGYQQTTLAEDKEFIISNNPPMIN